MPAPPAAGDLAEPRRLHPLTPVLDLLVSLRRLALPILVLLIGGPGGAATAALLVLLAGGVLVHRTIRWQRFSYRIEGPDLIIEEGVLHRSRRVVPLGRIQQVDVQRLLRHQLFGVAVLRVDTAGGSGGAEVELDVLDLAEAMRLRALLLARRIQHAPEPRGPVPGTGVPPGMPRATGEPGSLAPGEEERVVLRVPTWRLALAGISGARLAVILTVIASGLRLLEELPEGTARGVADRLPDTGPATAVLLFAALPVWFGLAAATAVLTDARFTLARRGDDLHVRRGLLDQREASTALHRVQAVRIQQNLLRRALGLATVQLQSAGSGTTATGDVSRITVPILPVSDLDPLLAEVVPGGVHLPPLAPAPPAARRRAIVRRAVPAALLALPVLLVGPAPATVVLAALALGLALVAGELAWRGLGHAAVVDHVVARTGGLLRETVVVPLGKVQSARLRSSPFQRRAGLATLLVDVAGRGRTPAIVDARDERLLEVRGLVLGAPAARRDERAVRRRARGR